MDIDIITPKKEKVKIKKVNNNFDKLSKIIKNAYKECLISLKEK